MRSTLGCGTLAFIGCLGCCCGRVPTFGLWPALDDPAVQAEAEAAVKAAPIVVDHVCKRDETCEVVDDAEVLVTPVGWNPFTGEVAAIVEVEARCRPTESVASAAVTCAGTLAAAYAATDAGWELLHVTEDALLFGPPSGQTYEEWSAPSDGGGFDWD